MLHGTLSNLNNPPHSLPFVGQGTETLMNPWAKDSKLPRPKGECLRVLGQVLWIGRAVPYMGVYIPRTHAGGHRLVASLRPRV